MTGDMFVLLGGEWFAWFCNTGILGGDGLFLSVFGHECLMHICPQVGCGFMVTEALRALFLLFVCFSV